MSVKKLNADQELWLDQSVAMARLCLRKHNVIPTVAFVYYDRADAPEGSPTAQLNLQGEIVTLDLADSAKERASVTALKGFVANHKSSAVLMVTETEVPTGVEEIPEAERESPILRIGEAPKVIATTRPVFSPAAAVHVEVEGGYLLGLSLIETLDELDADGNKTEYQYRTFADVSLQESDLNAVLGSFAKILPQNVRSIIEVVAKAADRLSTREQLLGKQQQRGVLIV